MKTKFILKSIFTVIILLVFSNISSLDIYALEKNDFYSETIDIKVAKKKRTKRKRKKRRISCNNLKSCTKYSKCRKTRKCKKIISDNEARKKEKAKKEKEEKLKKETKNNKNPKDTKKVVDGVKTSTKINPDDIKSKKNKKGVKKKRKANVVKGRRDIKGADFKSKLSIMLDYINKSISVLKQQITDNPHAPFLADLYLELGNLNAQKANTLYYIQMERMESDNSSGKQKKFSAVVEASKEAIVVYELLVRDFSDYHKIPEVMYLLALINNSIDNEAKFLVVSESLIKKYPKTKEAMQARMLLGRFHFHKGDYQESLRFFAPVSKAKFNFVKNQAIYNMGQVYMRLDKPKKALASYRKVVLDKDLEKNGVVNEVSIKNRKVSTSLKKEAIHDSIQPFTIIYPNHKAPEKYYAKLAPTEVLYQEVIEKLAFRYINLKKYKQAIRLLRVLSERSVDPEKVINIYQEVLTIIPLNKRINIGIEEIRFVLEKFHMWFSFYKINPKLKNVAFRFIEIQIRELGTRNHDLAKRSKGNKKLKHLRKALDFYQLYLGFFKDERNANKIAVNLADVYYRLKMFPESGDLYLRLTKGDFGKSSKSTKELIENALHALQQEKTYTFYENTWRRGLLLSTIKLYFKANKKKRNNDQLNFIYAKTEFEQGMYEQALKDLYKFVKKFPKSKYVVDSGELILNYFNTSGDYRGLEKWSARLLKLNFKDKNFKTKLEKIRKQAKLKTLDSDIQGDGGYSAFHQSRSYYKFALSTNDKELKHIALERALLKSREERDIDLFFKTAKYLKSKEKDKKKELAIYNSIANELLYMGRFLSALDTYLEIFKTKKFSETDKKDAYLKAFSIVLGLKHHSKFKSFIKNSYFKYVSDDLKEQLMQEIANAVEFNVEMDSYLIEYLVKRTAESSHITSLYKVRKKLSSTVTKKLNSRINSICREDEEETVCLWKLSERLEAQKERYLKSLEKPSLSPNDIGKYGAGFVDLTNAYTRILNSDDGLLRVYVIVQFMDLYQKFSTYLQKVADKNSSLKEALAQKISESLKTKEEYSNSCKEIAKNSETFVPIAKYCDGKRNIKISSLFKYENKFKKKSSFKDFTKGEVLSLQKEMFVGKNGDTYLELADSYLSAKKYNLANAVAVFGMSLFNEKSDNFTAILGCATLNLGLLNEAKYYLSEANDYQGLKNKCLEELRAIEGEK